MSKKPEKNDSEFNFDAIQEETKVDKNYLAALASTWKEYYIPRTAFQRELVAMELDKIEGLSPERAMMLFNRLAKIYEKTSRVTDYLDKISREKEVVISLSSMQVDGEDVIPTGGCMVELTATQHMAREVANILTIYTSQKSEYISELIESKVANEIKMPVLNAVVLRSMVKVPGSDNTETRDKMYEKLRKCKQPQDRCALMYALTKIYSIPSLLAYSKVDDEMTAWYRENNIKKSMNLPEIRIPCVTNFRSHTIVNPIQAWRFYCKSLGARGGKKGRGEISYGYYRFDLPSSTIELLNEMTDLFSICKQFHFDAITLEYPNTNLARLLVHNGISVYCPALSSVVQTNKKLTGVFSRGKLKTFIWMSANQTSPTLAKSTVTMPDPISIVTNMIAFVYEFIPLALDPGYSYLPSIFAAEGLCIKFKIPSNKSIEGTITDIEEFYMRFSTAVYFRNWFPFTRITYVSQDKYRDWFAYTWKYPKLTEDKTEDLFAGSIVEIHAVKETLIYSQIDESEAIIIEDQTRTLCAELKSFLNTYESSTVRKLYKSRRDFVCPTELGTWYTQLSLDTFFGVMQDYIGDLSPDDYRSEEERPPEKPKVRENDGESSEDDDNMFAGSFTTDIKAKPVSTITKEKK
jgi:hypothetical protein